MPQKLIAQGAEAKLFFERDKIDRIIKNRFKKSYRIKELDEKLRKFRTRREAKVLEKLHSINFLSPKLVKSDNKENLTIERINGELVKNILDKSQQYLHKKYLHKTLFNEIGKNIAIMHNNGIIHGDLTTSNIILEKNTKNSKKNTGGILSCKVYFIDFGLSFFSEKIEDKAVDLHLLKEALESKHYRIWNYCFKYALDAYKKKAKNSNEILKRLEAVENRGRYRAKKGG